MAETEYEYATINRWKEMPVAASTIGNRILSMVSRVTTNAKYVCECEYTTINRRREMPAAASTIATSDDNNNWRADGWIISIQ